MRHYLLWFVTLLALTGFLSGCGTTSAPTESTTNTTDKTSNSTMDATSSSTPGKDDDAAEETAKFTQNNFLQIKTDMANGGGEHLTALAALLQVPENKKEQFFALSQENYGVLYETPDTTPVQMLARLNVVMDLYPDRVTL